MEQQIDVSLSLFLSLPLSLSKINTFSLKIFFKEIKTKVEEAQMQINTLENALSKTKDEKGKSFS